VQTAAQAAAEVAQERVMVERALGEFPLDIAVSARTLLKGGNLYRSEKAEAIATWFVELHERMCGAKGPAFDRLLWNPVNWYVYPGGSPASQWGVEPGWRDVTALTLLPSMWGAEAEHKHQGKGVIALLRNCRDTQEAGIALFPEVLKSEYRSIRAAPRQPPAASIFAPARPGTSSSASPTGEGHRRRTRSIGGTESRIAVGVSEAGDGSLRAGQRGGA
jgi:hypothetical protein